MATANDKPREFKRMTTSRQRINSSPQPRQALPQVNRQDLQSDSIRQSASGSPQVGQAASRMQGIARGGENVSRAPQAQPAVRTPEQGASPQPVRVPMRAETNVATTGDPNTRLAQQQSMMDSRNFSGGGGFYSFGDGPQFPGAAPSVRQGGEGFTKADPGLPGAGYTTPVTGGGEQSMGGGSIYDMLQNELQRAMQMSTDQQSTAVQMSPEGGTQYVDSAPDEIRGKYGSSSSSLESEGDGGGQRPPNEGEEERSNQTGPAGDEDSPAGRVDEQGEWWDRGDVNQQDLYDDRNETALDWFTSNGYTNAMVDETGKIVDGQGGRVLFDPAYPHNYADKYQPGFAASMGDLLSMTDADHAEGRYRDAMRIGIDFGSQEYHMYMELTRRGFQVEANGTIRARDGEPLGNIWDSDSMQGSAMRKYWEDAGVVAGGSVSDPNATAVPAAGQQVVEDIMQLNEQFDGDRIDPEELIGANRQQQAADSARALRMALEAGGATGVGANVIQSGTSGLMQQQQLAQNAQDAQTRMQADVQNAQVERDRYKTMASALFAKAQMSNDANTRDQLYQQAIEMMRREQSWARYLMNRDNDFDSMEILGALIGTAGAAGAGALGAYTGSSAIGDRGQNWQQVGGEVGQS